MMLDHFTRDLLEQLAKGHAVPEPELKRLKFMMHNCRKVLQLAGISNLVEEFGTYDIFSSTHIFGTSRMASTKKQ